MHRVSAQSRPNLRLGPVLVVGFLIFFITDHRSPFTVQTMKWLPSLFVSLRERLNSGNGGESSSISRPRRNLSISRICWIPCGWIYIKIEFCVDLAVIILWNIFSYWRWRGLQFAGISTQFPCGGRLSSLINFYFYFFLVKYDTLLFASLSGK